MENKDLFLRSKDFERLLSIAKVIDSTKMYGILKIIESFEIYRDSNKESMSMDEYYVHWITERKNEIKPNSIRMYNSVYYRHISSKLGRMSLSKIDSIKLKSVLNDISDEASNKTRNYCLIILRAVLNSALDENVISDNPAKGIKAIKIYDKTASETYHRSLTEKEQDLFVKELAGEYYRPFILLLLCTGMRVGECAALTWKNMDFQNKVIRIDKTVTYDERGKKFIATTPKSVSSIRDIPMSKETEGILRQYKETIGKPVNLQSRVFLSPSGKIVDDQSVNRTIKAILKRLEKNQIHIEPFTAHALRHTFATRCIEQGINIKALQNILGHDNFAITMNLYTHVTDDMKKKETGNIVILK